MNSGEESIKRVRILTKRHKIPKKKKKNWTEILALKDNWTENFTRGESRADLIKQKKESVNLKTGHLKWSGQRTKRKKK